MNEFISIDRNTTDSSYYLTINDIKNVSDPQQRRTAIYLEKTLSCYIKFSCDKEYILFLDFDVLSNKVVKIYTYDSLELVY